MHYLPGKTLRLELIALILAVMVFLVGILVYSLGRQPAQVYFLGEWMNLGDGKGSVFGVLGQQLPTVIHVYTFILLTMALVVPVERYHKCLLPVFPGWFTRDNPFGFAQLGVFTQRFAERNLVSIGLGICAVSLVMQMIVKRSTQSAISVGK